MENNEIKNNVGFTYLDIEEGPYKGFGLNLFHNDDFVTTVIVHEIANDIRENTPKKKSIE